MYVRGMREMISSAEFRAIPQGPPIPPTSEMAWVQQWRQLTSIAPEQPRVPPEACHITTPLILPAWRHMLMSHENKELVHFFLQGIAEGFRIGYGPTFSQPSAFTLSLTLPRGGNPVSGKGGTGRSGGRPPPKDCGPHGSH